jgi:hypothetical protein
VREAAGGQRAVSDCGRDRDRLNGVTDKNMKGTVHVGKLKGTVHVGGQY